MTVTTEPNHFLSQGPTVLMDTVKSNVESSFGDADEIGTSDIWCCITHILDDLNVDADTLHDAEIATLRNLVHNVIWELKENN
jgi:hypothetical protein